MAQISEGLRLQLVRPADLRRFAKYIGTQQEGVRKDLRYVLTRTARPIMNDQKRAIRSQPVKRRSARGDSMRAALARSLRLRVRTGRNAGVFIESVPSALPSRRLHFMPRGMDSHFRGWKPGRPSNNRSRVVISGPSWFIGPASSGARRAIPQIQLILTKKADEIAAMAANLRETRA